MNRKTLGLVLPIVWSIMVNPSFSEDTLFNDVEIPYTKFVLDNGLRLIVHEDHKAPIAAVNVWYHVGSKNEKLGKTGFAHLFEHLMFNGSENFDDDYFVPLEKAGATDMNGTTNSDRTNYFQNVPTSALDVALWMESDRMGHLLGAIDQGKLDEQRGVVQNEKRQGENRPYGITEQLITDNTYPKGHPYSWTVIGSMEDLDGASLDDVAAWFKEFYGAANAVLSVAGDVDPEEVLAKVERYFGDIPSGPPVSKHDAWIAKRSGTQRQRAEDRVPQARLYKVWNVPQWGSQATSHLDLVSDLLADGKNSRLYKRLVYEDHIATDVYAYIAPREIAGQFMIVTTVEPGGDIATVERTIDEELARVIEDGPTKRELERIKTQHMARFVRGVERIGGFGGKSDVLAMGEIYGGSPDYYKTTLQWIRECTAKDIKNAAADWLSDGDYVLEIHPFPDYTAKPTEVDRSEGVPGAGNPPKANFPTLHKATLDNGLKVVLAERPGSSLVTMDLLIDAGFATDAQSIPGLTEMAMDMLDEGTTNRNSLEISEELALLGADLHSSSSLDTSTVTLSALKPKLTESLELFADVVLNPAFDAAEFERCQKDALASIEQEKASPQWAALRILPALLFGNDHPYGNPYSGSGTAEAVAGLTVSDLRAFHSAWFKPNNATLVVVGDTTLAELTPMLEKALGKWQQGDVPDKVIPTVSHQEGSSIYLIDRPGAQQSYILAGHIAPPQSDPNDLALSTMNRVLGGSFTSRVNMNLREDKHWSYGARTSLYDGKVQRSIVAAAPVQTDKTKESLIEMQKELDEILGDRPITEDELSKSQQNLTLRLPGQWETAGAVKGSIRSMVIHDLPEDYYDTYQDDIAALTVEGLQAAANDTLKPNRLVWVVVGDLSVIEEGVRSLNLGPVQVVRDEAEILK